MRLSSGVIPLILASSAAAIPFRPVNYKRYDNSSAVSVTPSASSGFSAIVLASSGASSEAEQDTTITFDEYITITLPDTTLTIPTSATNEINEVESSAAAVSASATSSDDDTTLTSTVIEYQTISSDGSETVQATNTYTTTVAPSSSSEASSSNDQVTTSTITKLTTITQGSSTFVAAVETDTETQTGGQCTPETVTVTVTKGEGKADASSTPDVTSTVTLTSTLTTSYPVEAVFTNGDDTTTITSYVQVTSTQFYTTAAGSSSYANSSIPATSSSFQTAGNNGTYYSSALPSATSGYEPVANAKRGFLFNY
ncbi:uncharacterized protein AC631_00707 [Debaryomyces fabryi]|uniref:Uncharacterized protein n=1 Tax=Debaryomyces fabryi TaxID=58627 RepID=A0A0V1Q4Z9_9ASCO|nr:uncharacterized protein AC631_00707 [Debaryomyces fabryi]KSA03568.1 hypothetical protein AC631_00707 [Debaryomyces fabryi]CUM54291.1 unnamed protein product [Debaryomyces fabryi]